ncbi:MAG: VWA domain-containing protein [Proteobacteria bacterium]|nr:VWA domain-containing protein [Pseudomonadota bacterium]
MKVLLVPVEAQKQLEAQRKKHLSATAEQRTESLIQRIIKFAKLLRINKIPVHTANERDAIAALAHIDINSRFEFYMALRTNMLMSQKYRAAFDILFLQFWRIGVNIPKKQGGSSEEPDEKDSSVDKKSKSPEDEEGNPKKDSKKLSNQYDEVNVPTYSLGQSLRERDFELITPLEMAMFDEVFRSFRITVKEKLGRRFKPSNKGKMVDLRRSIRQSTQRGGEIMNILTRDRKQTCALPIYRTLESAMKLLSKKVQFWSGGTDIGGCFDKFNRLYGGKLRKRNRILVILSDGWDKGDAELLKKQMVLFKRGFRKIVWLNPNLKYDRYEPLCLGMSTAMPYVDHFLPCHNLKTLEQFIELVKNI